MPCSRTPYSGSQASCPLGCEILFLSPLVPICWPAHWAEASTAGPQSTLCLSHLFTEDFTLTTLFLNGNQWADLSNETRHPRPASEAASSLRAGRQCGGRERAGDISLWPEGGSMAGSLGRPPVRSRSGGASLSQHCLVKQTQVGNQPGSNLPAS